MGRVAIDDFGPTGFQLVLLRRMADHQPGLVDDALRALGATRADLREANRRWQTWAHSRTFPRGEWRYRTALGPPEAQTERRVGDLNCRALLWPVPLWPDLRFEVLCAPGSSGGVWNEWLVRAPREARHRRCAPVTTWFPGAAKDRCRAWARAAMAKKAGSGLGRFRSRGLAPPPTRRRQT